jgi:hypothetical protein
MVSLTSSIVFMEIIKIYGTHYTIKGGRCSEKLEIQPKPPDREGNMR